MIRRIKAYRTVPEFMRDESIEGQDLFRLAAQHRDLLPEVILIGPRMLVRVDTKARTLRRQRATAQWRRDRAVGGRVPLEHGMTFDRFLQTFQIQVETAVELVLTDGGPPIIARKGHVLFPFEPLVAWKDRHALVPHSTRED